MYANPGAEKLQASESRHAKVHIDPLDCTMRRRHNVEISRRPVIPHVTPNPESALLDLTVKPVTHGGRQGSYSRGSSEIPAPNVMDKLGMQLTSEVTLFPSSSYMNKVKENPHSKSSQSKSVVSMSSSNHHSKRDHHESVPGSSRSKSLRSPSTSAVSQSAVMPGLGAPSPKDVQMRHHSQQHYPNHLNTKAMFGAPDRAPIIPGMSPSQGHSSNAITIKPMSVEEKKAAASMKDLEKAYQASLHASQFLQPPPYLQLLANPFLMSPQALMSIPGAIEQFQMYKDLFQQGGIPQFPGMQWPPHGPGGDRASK